MSKTYIHNVRVYYEDTDLGDVVYYANYLKFAERGRTEMLREMGVEQSTLKAEHERIFVVRSVDAQYLKAARYDDWLKVETTITQLRRVSLICRQEIFRENEKLFTAQIGLVCVDLSIRPANLPNFLMDKLTVES